MSLSSLEVRRFTTSEVANLIAIGGLRLVKRSRGGQPELEMVLTINEVAQILRMHPTTVYRLVKRGELPGFKIGGAWRINRATLDLFLSSKLPTH